MNILITGSNRGIGLELVRQYAAEGWRVFATCRRPESAHALHALADEHRDVSVHRLDVTRRDDLRALISELKEVPLDVLYNNAGTFLEADYRGPELGALRYDDWAETFAVNVLGAARATEGLVDNVAASTRRLVAVNTSHMGSIADITAPGSYYYRSSKAALNAAMRGLAAALEPQGVGVLLLHPGAVDTRMGPTGGIDVATSVRGLRARIEAFRPEDSGRFLRQDGVEMPW